LILLVTGALLLAPQAASAQRDSTRGAAVDATRALPAPARAQGNASHAADSGYITHAESVWAQAELTGNAQALGRIIADDFIEIGATGKRYSKADAINFRAVDLASNQVDSITIRFYGDAAIAFGSEAWKKKDGSAGRNLWTDTWVRRQGTWQIVSSAEQGVIPAK
jgi:hypothetical protein